VISVRKVVERNERSRALVNSEERFELGDSGRPPDRKNSPLRDPLQVGRAGLGAWCLAGGRFARHLAFSANRKSVATPAGSACSH
jgi:hypothetical protein